MRLRSDIADGNRIRRNINTSFSGIIAGSLKPRFKVVIRKSTLKNRSATTKPRPCERDIRITREVGKTGRIFSTPIRNSIHRIRRCFHSTKERFKHLVRIRKRSVRIILITRRRERRTLLKHVVSIEGVQITHNSCKANPVLRKTSPGHKTNRKTQIISQRTSTYHIPNRITQSRTTGKIHVNKPGRTLRNNTGVQINSGKTNTFRTTHNTGKIRQKINIIQAIRNKEIFLSNANLIHQRSLQGESLQISTRLITNIIISIHTSKMRNERTKGTRSGISRAKVHIRFITPLSRQKHHCHNKD